MKTVYVGLSGGVDSSVAAALLKEGGFNVIGAYMKNWAQDIGGVACPWAQDLADARAAAAVLDIPFKVFDFQEQYRQQVVDLMVAEYVAGRTPNPDILCNQDIKFQLFLSTALAEGADLIATGHYAQTSNGQLQAAHDENKDQTYFLYRVTEVALRQTLFPIGGMSKTEVREKARALRLPTADKPDSQGICFVGEVGIKAFLQQYVKAEAGPVVDPNGKILGQHSGAIFYTIGQRQGLGIGGGKPYYVIGKDMKTNTVIVTDNASDTGLDCDNFYLADPHWINREPDQDTTYRIRLRHRGELIPGKLQYDNGRYQVQLVRPERAVAAGQSAVIYAGNSVVGGGFIDLV